MNFDEEIERVGTHSMKWDMIEPLYGVDPKDGIAMWVADMDFRPPPSVTKALQARIDHGIYGYFADESKYREALSNWVQERHGYMLEPDHMLNAHGLVQGIALVLNALTNPGDGVIIFTPVYHAFARIINATKRDLVESPLALLDGRYEMDLDALEASLKGHEKLILISSPHNPGGRVWSREELAALGKFARKHGLYIVSDEIHMDLVFAGSKHLLFGDAVPDWGEDVIYLISATKSFNIAGALTGTIIARNRETLARLHAARMAMGMGDNLFGMIACTAAYEGGAEWMDALIAYLAGNAELLNAGFEAIPGVRSMRLEATYLAWVDFRGLGLKESELHMRVQKGAKIAANHGASFGDAGRGFMRFNIATRRANVERAVEQMQAAFGDIQ